MRPAPLQRAQSALLAGFFPAPEQSEQRAVPLRPRPSQAVQGTLSVPVPLQAGQVTRDEPQVLTVPPR